MKTVYLLKSKKDPSKHYIGITVDAEKRLKEHNEGKSFHTAKYVPWEITASIVFADNSKARKFERYLKHGSGYAFAKRHLW